MKADYINKDAFEGILALMRPANALALEVSVVTGLRIGDVLKIRKDDLCRGWLVYTAQKTGKSGKKRTEDKGKFIEGRGCARYNGKNNENLQNLREVSYDPI